LGVVVVVLFCVKIYCFDGFKPVQLLFAAAFVAPCHYYPTPLHWAFILQKSRPTKIAYLKLTGESQNGILMSRCQMSAVLEQPVQDIFSQNQDMPFTPRLTLQGWIWKTQEHFPMRWKVTEQDWPEVEEEIKGVEEEQREYELYHDSLSFGSECSVNSREL
jgi:hypothetical protein